MPRLFTMNSLFRHLGLDLTQCRGCLQWIHYFAILASISPNDEVVNNEFTISPFWPRSHPMPRLFTMNSLFRHFGLDLTQCRGCLQWIHYFAILASISPNAEVVYNEFTISPFGLDLTQCRGCLQWIHYFAILASSSPNAEVVYNEFTISPSWPWDHPRTKLFTISSLFHHFGLELTQGWGGLQ